VALAFEERGFGDIHPLIGGYDAWLAAKFPIEPK
jgi:rhodanese-related sulfurtransferase